VAWVEEVCHKVSETAEEAKAKANKGLHLDLDEETLRFKF